MECVYCGSKKIVRGLTFITDFSVGKDPRVQIYEKPDSFLKKPKQFKTFSNVCGECGRVELYINEPDELWESYLNALDNMK